jgi:hypothetical protein
MPAHILMISLHAELLNMQSSSCKPVYALGLMHQKSVPNSGLRLHAMLSDQEAYLTALQLHAHKYLKGLCTLPAFIAFQCIGRAAAAYKLTPQGCCVVD